MNKRFESNSGNGGNGDAGDGWDPKAIRSNIADTRADMDRTLDELGERLDPRNLLDDLLDLFRSDSSSGKDTRRVLGSAGRGLATTVRNHPVPSLLVGAGLCWLLVEEKASREGDGSSPLDDGGQGVGEKLSDAAATIGEKTSATMNKAKDAAHDVTDKARRTGKRVASAARRGAAGAGESLRHARQRSIEVLEDYPLGAAAGALAFGILAGLLLPPTRTEDRLLGEAADTAKRRMREGGERVLEKGADAVTAAMDAASEEVERQDLAAGDVAQKAKSIATKAFDAALEAGSEESRAAKELDGRRGFGPGV